MHACVARPSFMCEAMTALKYTYFMSVRPCAWTGKPNRPHVLVKTHRWSDDWNSSSADLILLTHRDLRAVLASYQRVGWTFHIPESYVAEHMLWRVRTCSFCKHALRRLLCCIIYFTVFAKVVH